MRQKGREGGEVVWYNTGYDDELTVFLLMHVEWIWFYHARIWEELFVKGQLVIHFQDS